MTSIIKLEALSGAHDNGPLCYLLQVDQVYILLDCGWNEHFEMGFIEALRPRLSQINAVLISYADIDHLGALPYLVSIGLKCPIYTTVPVYKMGQLFLYDWLSAHKSVEDFNKFDFDDIDAAFDRVQYAKYGQMINLKGDNGLQIMPLPAGHMIGGAIWRITKLGDEEIVYAVDFNHRKERHLMGCTFDGVGRPHLMITDGFSTVVQRRKTRDEALFSKLINTLREGGDAMIVSDTAGRILEIAHLLETVWQKKETGLSGYSLVLLSSVASSVIEAAKSQVEWMSDSVLKACETGQDNPFQMVHLKCCHSLAELNNVRSPKVVLVSGPDMECGLSRDLFLESCADSKNLVILTSRASDRTLGSKLIAISSENDKSSHSVKMEIKKRIRLEGLELEAYRAKKWQKEQEEARMRLENVRRKAQVDDSESSESDDDDEEKFASKHRPNAAIKTKLDLDEVHQPSSDKYDLMAVFEQQQKTSFFKQNKKQFAMFSYAEEKARWDEYGEIIRPEDYMKPDTIQPVIQTLKNRTKDISMKSENVDDEDGDAETAIPEEEWPTKCIHYKQTIEIFCKLEFIDLEGRADVESVQKIVAQIKPKQLVIVHGGSEPTRKLADSCTAQKSIQDKIFTPSLGEVIDLTIESHIFQVTLSDQLMSSLIFQPVRDVELSWVDAKLRRKKPKGSLELVGQKEEDVEMADPDAADEPELMDVDGVAKRPVKRSALVTDQLLLEILPSNNIPPHEAVFVNDPKLSDLKLYLTRNGLQAEFSSGELYVNDSLKISRQAGKFVVEGPACEEYYRIRDVIYTQFAIV